MTISPALASAYRQARKTRSVATAGAALAYARDKLASGATSYARAPDVVGTFARDAKEKTAFYESATLPLRVVGYADEVRPSLIQHTGWFADALQSEKFRGVVFQAPGRDGKTRFVAGYEDSVSGGYILELAPAAIFEGVCDEYTEPRELDAAKEAARAADSFAEREAEKSREYQEAFYAGTQWADLGDEVKTARRDLLAILAERRAVRDVNAPTLCKAIRAQVDSLLATISNARAKRAALADSVWRDHYEAFNDGAGAVILAGA